MEFTEMQAQEAARSAGIDLEKERFDLKALTAGMNAELEHGTASPDTNITNDDPVMTAKLCSGTSAGLAVLLCLRAGPESVGGFAP